MANNLLNTLYYYREDGQLRTRYEEGQALFTYSYDISLFDFNPDERLKKFAQKRAFIKTIMKFSDVYYIDKDNSNNNRFILDTPSDVAKFNKIVTAIKSYDPELDDVGTIKLFKDLYQYIS